MDVAVLAAARHADPPGIAADFAILDEAALDVGLDVDFHGLAAIRARDEMLILILHGYFYSKERVSL